MAADRLLARAFRLADELQPPLSPPIVRDPGKPLEPNTLYFIARPEGDTVLFSLFHHYSFGLGWPIICTWPAHGRPTMTNGGAKQLSDIPIRGMFYRIEAMNTAAAREGFIQVGWDCLYDFPTAYETQDLSTCGKWVTWVLQRMRTEKVITCRPEELVPITSAALKEAPIEITGSREQVWSVADLSITAQMAAMERASPKHRLRPLGHPMDLLDDSMRDSMMESIMDSMMG
ncbi:hypothetical protein CALVIDRAFT_600095 [Calocera viscosa TUFC12733]|uniref:Uncharacterized protein n=1 Tax=Calocera viscosa (strain TUFC12733) TaxID=1330018 RepID=A0A167K1M1_CALVF|nr:hypothetical protein CALVIDRAFT_600095 [Calocera viscosa TUFC12733]